jgi:hypothetical protein
VRPLDRDEAAYFAGVDSDIAAREQYMLAKGVRVIDPDIEVISQDDEYGSHDVDGPAYCPEAFPVIGTRYGVYYLDGDDMFPEFQSSSDQIALCFASAGAARAAGYIHGPIAAPPGQ